MTKRSHISIVVMSWLLMLNFLATAQQEVFGSKLIFADQQYRIPDGCRAESNFEVRCDDYEMGWLEVNDMLLSEMPKQFVDQSANEKGYQKKKVKCKLGGSKANAWYITYTTAEDQVFTEIVAFGKVKGTAMIFNLKVYKEVKTNEDLPELPAKILKLEL